jgi:hypothetical protein
MVSNASSMERGRVRSRLPPAESRANSLCSSVGISAMFVPSLGMPGMAGLAWQTWRGVATVTRDAAII